MKFISREEMNRQKEGCWGEYEYQRTIELGEQDLNREQRDEEIKK
jgi:hypothetical protein